MHRSNIICNPYYIFLHFYVENFSHVLWCFVLIASRFGKISSICISIITAPTVYQKITIEVSYTCSTRFKRSRGQPELKWFFDVCDGKIMFPFLDRCLYLPEIWLILSILLLDILICSLLTFIKYTTHVFICNYFIYLFLFNA